MLSQIENLHENNLVIRTGWIAATFFSAASFQMSAPTPIFPEFTRRHFACHARVAEWQLAHPPTNRPMAGFKAAGDEGIMALGEFPADVEIPPTQCWAKGETINGSSLRLADEYHADDPVHASLDRTLFSLPRTKD